MSETLIIILLGIGLAALVTVGIICFLRTMDDKEYLS
jgi:hypothetical protein